MSNSYADLLDSPAEQHKAPEAWPPGSYLCRIEGKEFGKTSAKQTNYVRFFLSPIQPQDDVDQDTLTTGGFTERLGRRAFRDEFYITPEAIYRIPQFCERQLGLTIQGKTTKQLLDEAVGLMVIAHVEQEADRNDPEKIYNRVVGYTRAS